jgi:sigma-B regulation protein RsbU (phosphoserine phosphatase)
MVGDRNTELLGVSSDALLDPLVLLELVRDSHGRAVDFRYRDLNQAASDYLGRSRRDMLGRGVLETTPFLARTGLFAEYVRCGDTGEPVAFDALRDNSENLAGTRRYDLRAARATPTMISLTWRDVTDRFREAQLLAEARELQQKADARYRRLMDSSGIGMGLLSPDGHFQSVNKAMCDFFGYDADALAARSWQELTAPDYLNADQRNIDRMLAGRIESYRMHKQYIHADGRLIWGDLSVSCLWTPRGDVESFIVQIIDITAEVEARERIAERDEQNRQLAQRLQAQTDRLTAELRSAAAYVASILPTDLHGPVRVSSRYLPSQELAGDSFDYRWIDDDHLIVYLIDVSGHGIGPALLSVSVHNMLRSWTPATLLAPERVLSELNLRFQMDQHDNKYLTMWFGVYESSSRTLRYASAGAPPAFAVTAATRGPAPELAPELATELATGGQPLGMFDGTAYTAREYTVPHGCTILVFSDGAYEHSLDTGRPEQQLSLADFNHLFIGLADSPLDDLVEKLRGMTPSGVFDDDCSLVKLDFD